MNLTKPPVLSIVLPLYNEAGTLVELHQRLTDVLLKTDQSYELVFVNDGSTDTTSEKVATLRAIDHAMVQVELTRNFGQTAALAAGIDVARGEIIITMDADLQHAPEDIPRFLTELGKGVDLVIGYRQKRGDNLWLRRIPSAVANWLMRAISGLTIKDFGSTYKACRAPLFKRLDLFGELHRFIPVLAHREGARISEIPIQIADRSYGTSAYGLGRTFGVAQDLLFLEFYANYLTKPIRAFGKLFLLFFGVGFAICSTLMALWTFGFISAVSQHSALLMLAIFLMITGTQFLVTGVLAELLSRIYLTSRQAKIYSIREVLHG